MSCTRLKHIAIWRRINSPNSERRKKNKHRSTWEDYDYDDDYVQVKRKSAIRHALNFIKYKCTIYSNISSTDFFSLFLLFSLSLRLDSLHRTSSLFAPYPSAVGMWCTDSSNTLWVSGLIHNLPPNNNNNFARAERKKKWKNILRTASDT